ncbi:hypothetical protein [Zavarzinella formosa]|uniref:hypothetical protein n=1 Tax=Zavarzinella formosa TaxID=360055 RepID=UPI000316975C|nr:hypothetical protein [Zavarzinella formosa]
MSDESPPDKADEKLVIRYSLDLTGALVWSAEYYRIQEAIHQDWKIVEVAREPDGPGMVLIVRLQRPPRRDMAGQQPVIGDRP